MTKYFWSKINYCYGSFFCHWQLIRVKQEAEETEKALRERIQRLEMSRLQLEEEVSHMKTASMTEKLHAEENISIAKQKVKIEEVRIRKKAEEEIRWIFDDNYGIILLISS